QFVKKSETKRRRRVERKRATISGSASADLPWSASADFSYPMRDVKRLRGAARNNGKRCGVQFARVIADAVLARVGCKPGHQSGCCLRIRFAVGRNHISLT